MKIENIGGGTFSGKIKFGQGHFSHYRAESHELVITLNTNT